MFGGAGTAPWAQLSQGFPSLSLAAFVGKNVILTSGCIIGACCNINTYEVIAENTVIYGADCLRRVQTERPQVGGCDTRVTRCHPPVPSSPWRPRRCLTPPPRLFFQPQTLQLDFLMKILPNYHHLKKTTKATSTPVKS